MTPGAAVAPETSPRALPLPPAAIAVLAVLAAGWFAMFGPAYLELSRTLWASDEQGHGPIILGVGAWLLWRKRGELAALPGRPSMALALPLLALGILGVAVGRSQAIWTTEIAAQIVVAAALLVAWWGPAALRVAWFPLAFWAFMIPWPGDWVAAITGPLKSAVSHVAAEALYAMGYPVGRSGVILNVGPYQLLVADACAGLNSLFTLEALGLLYMNLMRYTSVLRNVLLALVIVPIGFVANVVRVMVLVLVTVHFGDAAGQGFAHDFAGLVLFVVALLLILAADALFARVVAWREAR